MLTTVTGLVGFGWVSSPMWKYFSQSSRKKAVLRRTAHSFHKHLQVHSCTLSSHLLQRGSAFSKSEFSDSISGTPNSTGAGQKGYQVLVSLWAFSCNHPPGWCRTLSDTKLKLNWRLTEAVLQWRIRMVKSTKLATALPFMEVMNAYYTVCIS